MKVEEGVMVMKDGKGWGVIYEDSRSVVYGWVDPEYAIILDPKFCRKPTDATFWGSPDRKELKTGRVARVRRTTEVKVEIVE